jgi:hypothetical protein
MVDYSFVFDRVDGANWSEVRFAPNAALIEIRDNVAGVLTMRASTAWTIGNGATQLIEVRVGGRHVSVRAAGEELLAGVLGRFGDSAALGWHRNTAATGESVLQSILVAP